MLIIGISANPICRRLIQAPGLGVSAHRRNEVSDRLAPPVGYEPLRGLLNRPIIDDELDEAARILRGERLDDPVRHGVQIDGLRLVFS